MNEHKKNINRKLLISVGTAVVILLLLILGMSRAWFVNRANIATLVAVTPPSPISIRGTHGYTQTNLDLSYTEDEIKGKTVTIKRVISIATDEPQHRLEIAHTTNLKNFNFKVYAATEEDSGTVSGTADGKTYKYKLGSALNGKYLNATEMNNGYRKATTDIGDNFKGDQDNQKQAHAVPVYWLATDAQNGNSIENTEMYNQIGAKYLNYYVIEMSWQEDTKETDMVYVLAENVYNSK